MNLKGLGKPVISSKSLMIAQANMTTSWLLYFKFFDQRSLTELADRCLLPAIVLAFIERR